MAAAGEVVVGAGNEQTRAENGRDEDPRVWRMKPLLAFALAAFVLEQVPAFIGHAGSWIDLVTPFVVIGAAAWALRDARGIALAVALVAAVMYVDGHGIHLSANDVGHYQVIAGKAERVRHFWDERFGHIEWHLGFFALLAALAMADHRRGRPDQRGWIAALLIGWTLFTTTVEGEDWWLTLAAAAVFAGWAFARRRATLVVSAAATLVGAFLIGVWAVWQGGVPQFSQLGWL